ncbi:MAG TPA: peptidylprolyl isomerase [Anaerolineaceae bacterium]|jgi:peptidyl-prolyl cis-trans isomerase C|nr:peptidylprolyl isomerase [Anaerolineaceae bacterium]HOA21862.1 peptidylprolyl isomerase [Anaerolineaceae bacterium]HOG77598.1 peptidylprolyl isomerase [Anaerolineaceae bacterium]
MLKAKILGFLLLLCLTLAACQPTTPENPTQAVTAPEPTVITASATPAPSPTPTSLPAAALVNGEAIPLTYFQNEVLRYRASFAEGEALPADAEIQTTVINSLIDQLLLAQQARQSGYSFSDADVQARIEALLVQLGSGSALTDWMNVNFYDDAEFRYALKLSTEAAWQRDQIIGAVPTAVEQVRARQIFAQTSAGAERALANLNSGASFDDLAWQYSPETGGELGWFPRGYLLFPDIEAAAFLLAPGEHSGIIQTEIGYHIIQVMDRSEAHPLTTDARLSLQTQALAQWLEAQRSQARIEQVLP